MITSAYHGRNVPILLYHMYFPNKPLNSYLKNQTYFLAVDKTALQILVCGRFLEYFRLFFETK